MVTSARIMIFAITSIILLLGLAIAYWISNLISKPIILIPEVSTKIADGDLTGEEIKIKSNDETSDLVKAFNSMTNNLRKILTEVGQVASQVAISSEELTTGAHQTTDATKYVANITQKVASGTEREVESVENSVKSAREMNKEANEIDLKAYDVKEKVLKTSDVAIEEISKSAAEGTQSVSTFTEEQLATMEGITNSAGSLSKMSEQLLDLISTFKLTNDNL